MYAIMYSVIQYWMCDGFPTKNILKSNALLNLQEKKSVSLLLCRTSILRRFITCITLNKLTKYWCHPMKKNFFNKVKTTSDFENFFVGKRAWINWHFREEFPLELLYRGISRRNCSLPLFTQHTYLKKIERRPWPKIPPIYQTMIKKFGLKKNLEH